MLRFGEQVVGGWGDLHLSSSRQPVFCLESLYLGVKTLSEMSRESQEIPRYQIEFLSGGAVRGYVDLKKVAECF